MILEDLSGRLFIEFHKANLRYHYTWSDSDLRCLPWDRGLDQPSDASYTPFQFLFWVGMERHAWILPAAFEIFFPLVDVDFELSHNDFLIVVARSKPQFLYLFGNHKYIDRVIKLCRATLSCVY